VIRALTLTQPWAGLVASGVKLVENRSRRAPKPMIGQRFAIHASREIDRNIYERIFAIAPELNEGGDEQGAPWFVRSQITSALIAIVTLDSCLDPIACGIDPDSDEASAPLDPDQRRWFFGPYGYVLRDVRPLARPVPCKGMLGFWTVPSDVERLVMEQIDG
jgi:hypothetical protein